jgi:flagellar capping protein FliD
VGETVDLRLSSSRSTLASDLASLISVYNSAQSKVASQVGETAGLLSGDYIVREIQHLMRELAAYEGSGPVKHLADLGIEFNQSGQMEFNTPKFYSLSDADIAAAFEFLGSPTSGLGALSAGFGQVSDPISGLIRLQQNQYDAADDRLSNQISELTTRIELMQSSLSLRLQQADVLLAQLEAQQTMLDANIRALELAAFGKRD